jgi:hypothetical protein
MEASMLNWFEDIFWKTVGGTDHYKRTLRDTLGSIKRDFGHLCEATLVRDTFQPEAGSEPLSEKDILRNRWSRNHRVAFPLDGLYLKDPRTTINDRSYIAFEVVKRESLCKTRDGSFDALETIRAIHSYINANFNYVNDWPLRMIAQIIGVNDSNLAGTSDNLSSSETTVVLTDNPQNKKSIVRDPLTGDRLEIDVDFNKYLEEFGEGGSVPDLLNKISTVGEGAEAWNKVDNLSEHFTDSDKTLQLEVGDCEDHAIVLKALFNAAYLYWSQDNATPLDLDYTLKCVVGWVDFDYEHLGGHCYNLWWDGSKWVVVDPVLPKPNFYTEHGSSSAYNPDMSKLPPGYSAEDETSIWFSFTKEDVFAPHNIVVGRASSSD